MIRFPLVFIAFSVANGFSPLHTCSVPVFQRLSRPLYASSGDFDSLTVPELKDELRSRGLKVGGNKSELIDRLLENDGSSLIEEVEKDNGNANEEEISLSDASSFEELGVSVALLTSADSQGWEEPTPIQKLAIPEILKQFKVNGSNRSLWAEAPTGSGKTGAFALPMIQLTLENRKIERDIAIQRNRSGNSFQRNVGRSRRRNSSDDQENQGFASTLILVPTRELALQIGGVFEELVEAMPSSGKEKDNVDVVVITGGLPIEPQVQMLADRKLNNKNIDILVATPGRLADVLMRSTKEDSVEKELEERLMSALDAAAGKKDTSLSLAQLEDLDINKVLDGDDGGRSAIKDMISNIQYLVIDEADRLLSPGFKTEMDEVLKLLPKPRDVSGSDPSLKTLLFSATFPEQIQPRVEKVLQRLSGKDAPAPLRLSCATAGSLVEDGEMSGRKRKRMERTTQPKAVLEGPASTIDLRSIRIEEKDRTQALRRLIGQYGEENWDRILVFVGTRYASEHVARKLRRYSIRASELHGKLDQDARIRRLEDFKKGKIRVLVATDLASRGLDVQGLPAVVNYDLPRSTADFVHRIGRTGRAGNQGTALTFVTPMNEAHYDLIENRHLGSTVKREILPGFEPNEDKWEITRAATTATVEGVKHSDSGLAHDKMFGGIKGRRKSKKDKLREKAAREAAKKSN